MSYQKTISELPDVLSHSSSQLGLIDVYCYVLYVEMPEKGPLRIFITDFTSNPNISNPHYNKEIEIGDMLIKDDKILRIDVFSDKLDLLIMAYNKLTGLHIFKDLNSQYDAFTRKYLIYQKMWVVKLTISLKKYNNTIEARMKNIQNVTPLDNNTYLINLFENIMNLPESVLIESKESVTKNIPKVFRTKLDAAIKRDELKKTEVELGRTGGKLMEASQQIDNISQPAQTRMMKYENQDVMLDTKVKHEILSDDIVPDTLFGNDYTNSSPPQSDPDDLFFDTKQHSFRKLNAELNNPNENKIYKIDAYVYALIPKDWSYACVKGYQKSYITNKVEMTDPFIRPVELIITEQSYEEERKRSFNAVLDPNDLLTIYLDGDQVTTFFKIHELENLYTQTSKFNKPFYSFKNSNHIKLELFKKAIKINIDDEILVWSAKNLSIDNFGINSLK